MTGQILSAFLPIFALIALGYGVRATGYLPRELWAGINALNHRLLLPAFLLALFARSDLTQPGSIQLAGAAALAALVLIGAGLATALLLKASRGEGASLCSVAVQWNFVLTLGLAERLLGDAAPLAAAPIAAAGVLIGAGFAVASFAWAGSGSATGAVRRIVRDPVLLACVGGIALSFTKLGDHAPVAVSGLELLGAGSLAVILVAMGAGLDFSALKGRIRLLIAAAALRCGLGAVAFIAMALALGVTGDGLVVLALAGAAPGAAVTYAIAADFKGETGLVAGMLTLSVLVSAAVLPLAAALSLGL
jgi:malonate transporter